MPDPSKCDNNDVFGRLCEDKSSCPISCGSCGGSDCGERPRGKANCSVNQIETSGRVCGRDAPPCVIEGTAPPLAPGERLCSGSVKVCCPTSCGICTGDGCSDQPGGDDNCCTTAIFNSGRDCHKDEPPCAVRT